MKTKEIQPKDLWEHNKRKEVGEFIQSQSKLQSSERKLRNEMLAIQFKIEDYINSDKATRKLQVLDFVKMYLKVLNITQKRLAVLFEMQDSNLHKYLVGERKLNAAMLLKLSAFSHLSPKYWLLIEVKNELLEITKEQQENPVYEKYDYRNLLVAEE